MWEYNYEYISHGISGHKYIKRERGKKGKWIYTYPSESNNSKTLSTSNVSKNEKLQNPFVMGMLDRAIRQEERKKEKQQLADEFEQLMDEYSKSLKYGSGITNAEIQELEAKLAKLYREAIQKQMLDEQYNNKINADGTTKRVSFSEQEDSDIATNLYLLEIYGNKRISKAIRK